MVTSSLHLKSHLPNNGAVVPLCFECIHKFIQDVSCNNIMLILQKQKIVITPFKI